MKRFCLFAIPVWLAVSSGLPAEAEELKSLQHWHPVLSIPSQPGDIPELTRVVFSSFAFEDADLSTVFKFLERRYQRFDPQKQEITIRFAPGLEEKLQDTQLTLEASLVNFQQLLNIACAAAELTWSYEAATRTLTVSPQPGEYPATVAEPSPKLAKMLREIRVPAFALADTTIPQALKLLQKESKHGVGLILIIDGASAATLQNRKISLRMNDKPLLEIVNAICQAGHLKLGYINNGDVLIFSLK